ncbi:MAG: preprotein translocase subunit YajC [Acidimicrobiales bacterium]
MTGLIILALTFLLMWFLIILPQQRRVRAHQQLVSTLEVGDEVLTSGGLFGTITELTGTDLRLEVAPDVELRFARDAVLRRIEEPVGEDDDTEDDGEEDAEQDGDASVAVDELTDSD